MLDILEDVGKVVEKVVEGIKVGDWLIPTGIASGCAVVLGVILNLLSKKFPVIKEFFKLICKTVCGSKECSGKQKNTKKVKTSKN